MVFVGHAKIDLDVVRQLRLRLEGSDTTISGNRHYRIGHILYTYDWRDAWMQFGWIQDLGT